MLFSIVTKRSLRKHTSFGRRGFHLEVVEEIQTMKLCKETCKYMEKRKVFNKIEVSQMFRKLPVVKVSWAASKGA